MKPYTLNIEQETLQNTDYRRVLYTTPLSQLVLMSLAPGEEIGIETHTLDQFIRIEAGTATAMLDGQEHSLPADWAVIVPAGTEHNILNNGSEPVKLYTIYTPPEHKHDTVQPTKADAREEHFDGVVGNS